MVRSTEESECTVRLGRAQSRGGPASFRRPQYLNLPQPALQLVPTGENASLFRFA